MKPGKSLVFITTISVIMLLLGLFLPWLGGEPTGKRTTEQVGNIIHVNIERESISGWRVIFTGLSPACVIKTFGPNWTMLPLVVPIFAILAIVFVLLPWRKRPAIKRDGYLLTGMGILAIVSQFVWKPTCPAETIASWRYVGNNAHNLTFLLGTLLMIISGVMVVFAKPQKAAIEGESRVIEYHTCLKCKESIDKDLQVCPHCGNQMK